MARTDVIVLGAGIVGTAIALHLAKRGLAVAMVDRRGPGEEISCGNTGIIEGSTIFPAAFPRSLGALARVALKRAPEANYHLSFLPKVAPWLLAFRAWSQPDKLVETAHAMRPLFGRAIAEHEALMAEAGATHLLRKTGWLKLYRRDEGFAATARERALAERVQHSDSRARSGRRPRARALAQSGLPPRAPLGRRREHFRSAVADARLCGAVHGARRHHPRGRRPHAAPGRGALARRRGRGGGRCHRCGGGDGTVVAGPARLLRHPAADGGQARLSPAFPSARQCPALAQPITSDADNGYCICADAGGHPPHHRHAEFADRDAPPTPVQIDRVLPAAKGLFPLGDAVETKPWMGNRPCFADSRPVIGAAPGQPNLWLAFGHAHWGLALAAITGRLIADIRQGKGAGG